MAREARELDRNPREISRLVPIEAVMQAFSLPRTTVYQLVNDSGMPCYRPGKRLLFSLDEVDKWIREHWAHSRRGSYSRQKRARRTQSAHPGRVLNGAATAVATPVP